MTNTIHLTAPASCSECGFSTTDINLLARHSCDVQAQGGRCEDYPCCGHEAGDCNGQLYGSDEAIKAEARAHIYCDHEAGVYDCYGDDSGDDYICDDCGAEDPDDCTCDDSYDEVAFTGSDY
jgi:hypothetical protein